MNTLLGVLLVATVVNVPTEQMPSNYTVTRGTLSVHYQVKSDQKYLATVFDTWAQASRRLAKLGLQTGPVQLIASRHAADFAKRTGGKSAHIAGLTYKNTIYTQRLGALAQRRLLKSTIQHEAFHTVQPRHLPRWLSEGLARIFSEQISHDPRRTGLEHLSPQQLDQALLNSSASQLKLAYAEASNRAWRLLQKRGWQAILSAD